MLLQSFTHLNAHILTSNKWNAERKDMICSKKWIKSPVFSQTSVFGSQHLWSMLWYKKKEGYLCLFVFICVFGVKASTTLQLVLGHSNLAKKSWLVESLNLNCHLTISTNSTHKHDEPGCSCMRTKSIGISRHIDRFLFALWKRTLSRATQIATWRPCCLSCANTYSHCNHDDTKWLKAGSNCQTRQWGRGVKMPPHCCLFLAFQNTCWLSQWK